MKIIFQNCRGFVHLSREKISQTPTPPTHKILRENGDTQHPPLLIARYLNAPLQLVYYCDWS